MKTIWTQLSLISICLFTSNLIGCGDPLPSLPDIDAEVVMTEDMSGDDRVDMIEPMSDLGVDQGLIDMNLEAEGLCQSCDDESPCPSGYQCFNNEESDEQFCSLGCESDGDCPSGYTCGLTGENDGEAPSEAGAESERALFCIPDEGRCSPKLCRDEDGDGYGRGPDCLGLDCADDNPDIHEGVSVDLCDNTDNDCDGLFDENFSAEACGQGVCQGMTLCEQGRIRCDGPEATSEDANCNSIDEDCDGSNDEGYQSISCGFGACAQPSSCINGEEQCVGSTPPADDVDLLCDRIDSDCDGSIDEGFSMTSQVCDVGVCAARSTCTDQGEVCDSRPPLGDDVLCDGLDNDCDGSVDEGFIPSSCGLGVCQSAETCINGISSCVDGSPVGEDNTCDMLDDDCDGVIDNLCVDNISQLGFSLIENTPSAIEIAVNFSHAQADPLNLLVMPTLMNLRFRYPTSLTLAPMGINPGAALIETFTANDMGEGDILLNNDDVFAGPGRARFLVPNPQPFSLDYVRTGPLIRLRFTKTNQVSPLTFEWVTDGVNPAEITNQTGILPVQLNNAEF